MANALHLFLAPPEDELAFLRFLSRYELEVYPRRVPPDWQPFRAQPEALERLPPEELYLVASNIGPALVSPIKRGPDKGFWRIDEVRSPVVFFERSRLDEEGALLSGQLWAELDVTPQTGRRTGAADAFRRLFLEVEEWLKKTCRRSDPKGFLIGPRAARRHKEEGLVLRDARGARPGGPVVPYK